MDAIDRKYEVFLVDLPYCGGKHNVMIWQLYDAIAAFAYWEVLPVALLEAGKLSTKLSFLPILVLFVSAQIVYALHFFTSQDEVHA